MDFYSLNILFNKKKKPIKLKDYSVMMCLFSLLMSKTPLNDSTKRWPDFNTTVEAVKMDSGD